MERDTDLIDGEACAHRQPARIGPESGTAHEPEDFALALVKPRAICIAREQAQVPDEDVDRLAGDATATGQAAQKGGVACAHVQSEGAQRVAGVAAASTVVLDAEV